MWFVVMYGRIGFEGSGSGSDEGCAAAAAVLAAGGGGRLLSFLVARVGWCVHLFLFLVFFLR